eukprot:TRINITY_DN15363_c0_g1_i1.p1 TRINITY_DN15363_c0_g1~~TRINITY_DN15363_c0_g1_i1.p1  ORF type:complete len:100 (-),score=10.16 TRINITY_DN15363_c0_g1_i1:339-638(-)
MDNESQLDGPLLDSCIKAVQHPTWNHADRQGKVGTIRLVSRYQLIWEGNLGLQQGKCTRKWSSSASDSAQVREISVLQSTLDERKTLVTSLTTAQNYTM